MKKSKAARSQELIAAAQQLYQKNLLAAADGNLSYRHSEQEILITPSGLSKAHLQAEDMAIISPDNHILQGTPSSERLMHLAIYKQTPAKAVVHAHPPHAIALSLARPHWQALPIDSLPEVILAAGSVPIVPYARPGSIEMGEVLTPFLPHCRLMILARHGAVCWGDSLAEATQGIERLEQICQILYLSESLGGARPLPSEEIDALKALRQKIGDRII
ncbi:MAG: class II aldolase/adducin family protein [Candidatus Sericytochromatia bacterium]|nr:class II aldolase/adducin family protein [Candidatus Sericytochromatia bacterium]